MANIRGRKPGCVLHPVNNEIQPLVTLTLKTRDTPRPEQAGLCPISQFHLGGEGATA
ncbi:hypothetical protein [Altererythrobacter sp.]|uniref:hypothetical protein n=1 Tax=Altererythrobacter sp. TaxID=1872480 RepID=UPI003CFC8169